MLSCPLKSILSLLRGGITMLVDRNWSLLSYLFMRIIFPAIKSNEQAWLHITLTLDSEFCSYQWSHSSNVCSLPPVLAVLKNKNREFQLSRNLAHRMNTLQGNWTEGNVDGVGLWERTMKNSRRFSSRGPEACTYEDKTMGFVGAFLSDRSNRQDPGLPPHPAKQGTVWAKEVITPSCAFKPLMGGVAWGCWLSFCFILGWTWQLHHLPSGQATAGLRLSVTFKYRTCAWRSISRTLLSWSLTWTVKSVWNRAPGPWPQDGWKTAEGFRRTGASLLHSPSEATAKWHTAQGLTGMLREGFRS